MTNNDSKLEHKLINSLKHTGYLPLDQYLKEVITYYYANNIVFGKAGDFTTAPEISQLFGEIIGLWCAHYILNTTGDFCLLELGAGRGTLLNDVLRIIKKIPTAHAKLKKVFIVENSPTLQDIQRLKLAHFGIDLIIEPSIPLAHNFSGLNMLCIANEFFDALPIKQFIRTTQGVNEIVITLRSGKLALAQLPVLMEEIPEEAEVGDIWETSAATKQIAEELITCFQHAAFAVGLIIDYGYFSLPKHSTLQAIKQHKFCSILENIGEADLSSLVDFQSLAKIFSQQQFFCFLSKQGDFLYKHGIIARAQSLIQAGAGAARINQQVHRLCNPKEMGELFKVLEIYKS